MDKEKNVMNTKEIIDYVLEKEGIEKDKYRIEEIKEVKKGKKGTYNEVTRGKDGIFQINLTKETVKSIESEHVASALHETGHVVQNLTDNWFQTKKFYEKQLMISSVIMLMFFITSLFCKEFFMFLIPFIVHSVHVMFCIYKLKIQDEKKANERAHDMLEDYFSSFGLEENEKEKIKDELKIRDKKIIRMFDVPIVYPIFVFIAYKFFQYLIQ